MSHGHKDVGNFGLNRKIRTVSYFKEYSMHTKETTTLISYWWEVNSLKNQRFKKGDHTFLS